MNILSVLVDSINETLYDTFADTVLTPDEPPEVLEDYLEELKARYPNVTFEYYQSNVEGEMINKIHEVGFDFDGIILNAGAYTHTSIALQDAIRAVKSPVIEVHISNVHQREEFRHKSMISCACVGVICGFGLHSYRLAVEALLLNEKRLGV